MNLRRQAAKALAEIFQAKLGLETPPTVIAAPPSAVGDSPAMAIWIERSNTEFHHEEELSVDEDGELRVGALASLDPPAGAASIDGTHRLSKIGALRCEGRLWAGCRLPPKREEIEGKISRCFSDDPTAPGSILVTLQNPKVDGLVLPWHWTGAAFIGGSEWTDEYAFSERLWTWMKFELDLDILVSRSDPMMTSIVVALSQDEDPENADPATEMVGAEKFTVDVDGNIDQYAPPP